MAPLIPKYIVNRLIPDTDRMNLKKEVKELIKLKEEFKHFRNTSAVPQTQNFHLYEICRLQAQNKKKELLQERVIDLEERVNRHIKVHKETITDVVNKVKNYQNTVIGAEENKNLALLFIISNLIKLKKTTKEYEKYLASANKLLYIKDIMQGAMDTYEIYSSFFEKIIETSERYGHFSDFCTRFDKIFELRKDLGEEAFQTCEEAENCNRERLVVGYRDYSDILGLTVKLRKSSITHHNEILKYQSEEKNYLEIINSLEKRRREYGNIALTIIDILHKLEKFRNIDPSVEKKSLLEQIDVLREEFFRNKEVIRRWEIKKNEETFVKEKKAC